MGLVSFMGRLKFRSKDKLITREFLQMGMDCREGPWRCETWGDELRKWFPARIIGMERFEGYVLFKLMVEYQNRPAPTKSIFCEKRWIRNIHQVKDEKQGKHI